MLESSIGPCTDISAKVGWKSVESRVMTLRFVNSKGLGHFPMAENYEVFKSYLAPVLNQIAAAESANFNR